MELEFLEIDSKNAWPSILQEIRNESNNYSHIIKDAKKTENKNLNRYRDVNPFDHSRVRLQRSERDYINASLVSVSSADRSYILTQGPLPTTTGHFWLMVWEQKSKAILMLNRVIEKDAVKCHQYWPIGAEHGCNEELCLTDVKLKVTFLNQTDESYYTMRTFLLSDLESNESREVIQFHYTTWPDFGVPESPAEFLNFLFTVRQSGALNNNVGPPVVHCSAGIGRSGTFCLVDSCLVLIEKNDDLNSVNVRQQLLEMRHYRMGLIQTPEQLRFSYLSIIKGAKLVLTNNGNLIHLKYEATLESVNATSKNVGSGTSLPINFNEKPPPLPPRTNLISDVNIKNIQSSLVLETNNGEIISNKSDLQNKKARSNVSIGLEKISRSSTQLNSKEGSSSNQNSFDLRKRARKEREEKTAILVQNIKKKQKEVEQWDKRRFKDSKRKRVPKGKI